MSDGSCVTEIGTMKNHFVRQAEGRLPYTPGFVVVGTMTKSTTGQKGSKHSKNPKGIVALQPSQAMV